MKSTTLALSLALLASHAQAAEAGAVAPLSAGLTALLFLSMPCMFYLLFRALCRKGVFSANPNRRRWTWAQVWMVVPFLYLSPFGLTDLYLLPISPLCLIGETVDNLLGASAAFVGWSLAAAGWALLGMLFAEVRTFILKRRAKHAPAAPEPSDP